jgi:hypothetical protein
VRVKFVLFAVAVLLASALFAPRASAQNPDTMMPEQNVAKGKQILNDLIAALGAAGYTDVRESECSGRRVLFGHSGEVVGNIEFAELRRYPDKVRTEYVGKLPSASAATTPWTSSKWIGSRSTTGRGASFALPLTAPLTCWFAAQ